MFIIKNLKFKEEKKKKTTNILNMRILLLRDDKAKINENNNHILFLHSTLSPHPPSLSFPLDYFSFFFIQIHFQLNAILLLLLHERARIFTFLAQN